MLPELRILSEINQDPTLLENRIQYKNFDPDPQPCFMYQLVRLWAEIVYCVCSEAFSTILALHSSQYMDNELLEERLAWQLCHVTA